VHHDGVVRENLENLLADVLIGGDERAQDMGVFGYHLGHPSYPEKVALAPFVAEVLVREEVADCVAV